MAGSTDKNFPFGTYDAKCFTLAAEFLEDVEAATMLEEQELASLIQEAIEDFIAEPRFDGRRA